MNIKLELLAKTISEVIEQRLDCLEIDVDQIVQTTAISALAEIQEVIQNSLIDDFTAMEETVCIFEKYHLDFGIRHDFC
ncbi:MAG: hypothetical protein E7397_07925 [Ruminococcaceae bacterium]|nr:hypothetical protein [Oscillospiraceae bacterium]